MNSRVMIDSSSARGDGPAAQHDLSPHSRGGSACAVSVNV
jgi:hypothetical protein